MPFSDLDAAALGRSLAQIADREGDVCDLFLERREMVELGAEEGDPGVVARREEGFALRLLRAGSTWMATRDELGPEAFAQALREVARARPRTPYRPPRAITAVFDEPLDAAEVGIFPAAVERRIRAAHVAFPYRIRVRRFRRWVQVVGRRLVGEPMAETFYAVSARLPWGRHGGLLVALDDDAVERTAAELIDHFHAHQTSDSVAASGSPPIVLGPAAAAVLLHEAVAHALEADTLILSGRPEAARGVELGSELLNVLDDPAGAPPPVARRFDDEGVPVTRRWLLRGGRVQEPLADLFYARSSEALSPGAARRADRHAPPAPRSTHLELLPGESPEEELWRRAAGGLWAPLASRGRLDPVTGEFELELPFARDVTAGGPAGYRGPFGLRGRVHQLLGAIEAVGTEARFAGAGWCAKGGRLMPVWATCPPLVVRGLEIFT